MTLEWCPYDDVTRAQCFFSHSEYLDLERVVGEDESEQEERAH